MNTFSILIQALVLFGVGFALLKLRQLHTQIRNLSAKADASLKSYLDENTSESVNAVALTALNLRFPVFMGGPSIDASHGRLLIQQLVYRTPSTIVELGSGTSTVLVAKTMQLMGSTNHLHVSVDHDDFYLQISKRYAMLNEVADSVKFAHCPLKSTKQDPREWYSNVPETLEGRKIDLLIIDGPPAYETERKHARGPTLDNLYPHLDRVCTIILDDANRPGERDIIEQWTAKYPEFRVRRLTHGKGIVVLHRGEN